MSVFDREWTTLHELYVHWHCEDVDEFLELVKERSIYKGLHLYLTDLYELTDDCDFELDWIEEQYCYYPVGFGLKIDRWTRFYTNLISNLKVVDNVITFNFNSDFDDGHDQMSYRIVDVDIEGVARSVLAGDTIVTWDDIYISVDGLKTFEQRYLSIDHNIDIDCKFNSKPSVLLEYRTVKEDPKALKVLGLLIHHLAQKNPYKNPKGEPNLSKIKDDILDMANSLNIDSLGLAKINERLLKEAIEHVNDLRDLNK